MRAFQDICIGHLLHVFCNLRDSEWDTIYSILGPQTIDSMVMRCSLYSGPKWAYGDEDKPPLIVGGFIPQRLGVYSSWFFPTINAWSIYPSEVTKVAVERKRLMFEESGAHRIETVCLASDKLAQRWYKSIGFNLEATMTGYCANGTDAVMYVDTLRKH